MISMKQNPLDKPQNTRTREAAMAKKANSKLVTPKNVLRIRLALRKASAPAEEGALEAAVPRSHHEVGNAPFQWS